MKRILLILLVAASANSLSQTWKEAMKTCLKFYQNPASFSDVDKIRSNTWIGQAKYQMKWGDILVRIQRVDMNKTCQDCDLNCEFCVKSQINKAIDAISSLQENRKFVVANFSSEIKDVINDVPEPNLCLVKNAISVIEYVSCDKSFEDGCMISESLFKIVLQTNKSREISMDTTGIYKNGDLKGIAINYLFIPFH